MKIINKNPWFFFILKWFFPNLNRETSIITFGDTIYTRHNIPEDWKVHELTHIRQQHESKIYGTYFMIRFVLSAKYRLRMELEAFREQYRYADQSDNALDPGVLLDEFAKNLSGPLYNNLVTYEKAIHLIRDYVGEFKGVKIYSND